MSDSVGSYVPHPRPVPDSVIASGHAPTPAPPRERAERSRPRPRAKRAGVRKRARRLRALRAREPR